MGKYRDFWESAARNFHLPSEFQSPARNFHPTYYINPSTCSYLIMASPVLYTVYKQELVVGARQLDSAVTQLVRALQQNRRAVGSIPAIVLFSAAG